jgi:hypothetical protein
MHAFNAKFDHIHLWVQLWGLPFDLMSKHVVQEIGDRMGACVKIDERPWSSDQARFMRIRVELEIQKPLRQGGMVIIPKANQTWVHYRYKRLPVFCFTWGVLGHEAKACRSSLGSVGEFQYGDWLRANGRIQGTGLRLNLPCSSKKGGGGQGESSQTSAREDLNGASVKESINDGGIRGHSFRDNVSNIASTERRLFSKSKFQTGGKEVTVDVPGKEVSPTIPLSDSNHKIFGDTYMGLEMTVYEDISTHVHFKQGGTKPKIKATWKRLQPVDHMAGVKLTLLMHGAGSKQSVDHVFEDSEVVVEKQGRTRDGPVDSNDALFLAVAVTQPRHSQ